jgi:hypothetical protein
LRLRSAEDATKLSFAEAVPQEVIRRNFSWHLPASSGIPDVRVRVIARDQIFQDSSDGSATVFSITP